MDDQSKKQQVVQVEKGWGSEIIFVNTDKYCGKLLNFKKDAKLYVMSGLFTYKWINTANADILTETLSPGDVLTNKIGEPHQIICIEDGTILEVSTTHFDEDSYRVMKGDSQLLR